MKDGNHGGTLETANIYTIRAPHARSPEHSPDRTNSIMVPSFIARLKPTGNDFLAKLKLDPLLSTVVSSIFLIMILRFLESPNPRDLSTHTTLGIFNSKDL
jgi:hypothetical protein